MPSPGPREPSLPAPGLLRHPVVWITAAGLLLVPFLVKIPKGLNNHPVIGPFGDQFHVVLLGAATFLLYWAGPLRGRVWWAAGAAVLAGAAIEFVQIPFGRSALLKDFLLDLLGIGLATAWILWRGDRIRWARTAFLVLLLALPLQMWRQPFVAAAATRGRGLYPVIADFEGRYDRFLWSANMEAGIEVASIPDGPAGPTRVLRVTGAPPVSWPGVMIRRFPRDWTGFRALTAQVRLLSGPEPGGRLGVRLDDVPGIKEEVWISQSFDIGPDWRTITFEFAGRNVGWGSGRAFDHADLERIILFLLKPAAETVIEIDDVRLVK